MTRAWEFSADGVFSICAFVHGAKICYTTRVPEWKTYTAEVDKAATPIDRVMFKFFVSKDSVADFDDCVVTPVG